MKAMFWWKPCSLVALATLSSLMFAAEAATPGETTDKQQTLRLISEALKSSPLETNLRTLTDDVGGRVPGTPAFQRAAEWATAAFKEAGGERVHTEEFSMPHSWSEGATSMTASLYSGTTFPVRAVSVAWAPALEHATHLPIVDVGEGSAEDFARVGDISGKVLLVHSKVLVTWDDLFLEYERAPQVIKRAVKGNAKAIAFMATRDRGILYRHTNSVSGEIDALPQLVVARQDGERIARLLATAHPVWADISIPNKIGGPFKTWNVVAEIPGTQISGTEIPGTQKPQEFVILGAHLDSWELGTGALDNGCNSALVIDALRAIKDSGLKPKRTIRFILFSGEEEGLLGSRAYATSHRKELDSAAGVIIFDSGTGKTTSFSSGGRKDVVAAATAMLAPLEKFGVTKAAPTAEAGTDHFDFMLEGVPTFVADQDEANYMENYHATTDTYDKVDFTQLKKNVAVAAYFTFALANAETRLGPRISREQIEETLRESKLDQELKNMGMWDEWEKGRRGRER